MITTDQCTEFLPEEGAVRLPIGKLWLCSNPNDPSYPEIVWIATEHYNDGQWRLTLDDLPLYDLTPEVQNKDGIPEHPEGTNPRA